MFETLQRLSQHFNLSIFTFVFYLRTITFSFDFVTALSRRQNKYYHPLLQRGKWNLKKLGTLPKVTEPEWDELCVYVYTGSKCACLNFFPSAGWIHYFSFSENSGLKVTLLQLTSLLLLANMLNWIGIGRNCTVGPQVSKCRKGCAFQQSKLHAVEGGKIPHSDQTLSFQTEENQSELLICFNQPQLPSGRSHRSWCKMWSVEGRLWLGARQRGMSLPVSGRAGAAANGQTARESRRERRTVPENTTLKTQSIL